MRQLAGAPFSTRLPLRGAQLVRTTGLDRPSLTSTMIIVYHHRTRAADSQRVHITEMAGAFRRLGHSVHFASLVRTERAVGDTRETPRLTGWQKVIRRIPFAYEGAQLGYNAVGVPLLLWKAVRLRCDFVYERYALFNWAGIIVARLLKKPLVLEVNSPFALEQARDGHIRATRFARWAESAICNAATHVVVVSESLRRILIDSGVEPRHVVVMHNGVNLDRFGAQSDPRRLREHLGVQNKCVVGFVGWFRRWHGLQLLVDAFAYGNLASRGAVLLLVGDGQVMKPLRCQIDRLGLGASVIMPGAITEARVAEYVALFDVAVQPAANEYCCPLKIIEYMALAKPVVAPNQPNIQELLTSDENAVLFKPGDVAALAGALGQLISDPRQAKRLGLRARAALHTRGLLWQNNAEHVVQLVGSAHKTRAVAPALQRAPLREPATYLDASEDHASFSVAPARTTVGTGKIVVPEATP